MSGMQKRFSVVDEAKEKSVGMSAYEILRGAKSGDLEALEKEYADKKKAIENRMAAAERNTKLPEKIVAKIKKRCESELEALDFEYLGGSGVEGKLEVARRGAKSATRGEQGKTREEAAAISGDKLKVTNPLLVPVKAQETGPGQLNFSQMLAVANRDIDVEDASSEELINFRDAINSLNGLTRNILKIFKAKVRKGSTILSGKDIGKILKAVSPDEITIGRTEQNPDLIKLFWLYLGGEDILRKAKSREAFVNALTKLEKRNKSSITRPIADINSLDDIIVSEEVKVVFGHLAQFLANDPDAPKNAKDILSSRVSDIIFTPDAIYSGFSMSTSENVADTLYYAIIDAFGTPEDKTLLLKRNGTIGASGLKGSSNRFLSREALDALALKVKYLTTQAEDFKQARGEGRIKEWGVKKVNTVYEKYRGGKVLSAIGGKFVRNLNLTDVEKSELDSIIGQIFAGVATPLVDQDAATQEEIKALKEKIRQLSTPSAKEREPKLNKLIASAFPNLVGAELVKKQRELQSTETRDAYKKLLAELEALGEEKAEDSEKRAELTAQLAELKATLDDYANIIAQVSEDFKHQRDAAIEQLAALENQVKSKTVSSEDDIRTLFLTKSKDPDFIARLKDTFIARLNVITKSVETRISSLRNTSARKTASSPSTDKTMKTPEEFWALSLEKVLKSAQDAVTLTLDKFNSLTPADLEQLTNLFTASENAPTFVPSKTKSHSVNKGSDEGKVLIPWANSLIDALAKYEVQTPGTIGKDETELSLEKRIKAIQTSIGEVEADLDKPETSENSGELLNKELQTLTNQFNEAQAELKDYLSKLDKLGLRTSMAGDKRQADALSLRLKKLLSTANLDVDELQSIVYRLPKDVFKYLDKAETRTATDLLDSFVEPSSDQDDEWKARVRKAIYIFSHYTNSAEFSAEGNEARKTALNELSSPFVSELEDTSEYSAPVLAEFEEYDDDKALAQRTEETKKHLRKLELANKPTTRAKKALRKLTKINKRVLSGLYILPSTALRGEAIVVPDNVLYTFLLDNARKLESNAKIFYNNVMTLVKDHDILEQIAGPDKLFSVENRPFVEALRSLISGFKQTLSTDPSASDLEDTLFLDDLIDKRKLSLAKKTEITPGEAQSRTFVELDDSVIIKSLTDSDAFKTFIAVLNQSIEDNTIWYEKRVVNAPVIAGLGLKSAALLNMISCLKNYESIESFDLSLNKRNKNILSELLDTVNYPKEFSNYSSTRLMMKLFFLTRLKKAVEAADVINSFSGDFIQVNLKVEEPDEITKEILLNNKRLNDYFEKSVLAEFKKDFSSDGTLDTQIKENLELLWEIIENAGGNLYSIDPKTGATAIIPVTKDSLMHNVIEQGKDCLGMFTTGLRKKDAALENMLRLFDRAREEDLVNQLKNVIDIVKTGLNFWIGREAMETISRQQLYNEETKETNLPELSLRLAAFDSQDKYVAFVSLFKTEQDTQEVKEGDKTKKVKLASMTTGKVDANVKGGFRNLKNAFLSAFIKDFIWETIRSPLAKLEKEELKKTDIEVVAAAERTAREEKLKVNKEIEGKFDVFFSGVFKKLAGSSEEGMIDFFSDEAQKKVTRKLARDLKKSEEMLSTGIPTTFAPLGIVPSEDGKTLGLIINIKKDNGYSQLLGSNIQKQAEDFTFGQLITTFSGGLTAVVEVLSRVYSNYPDLVQEIKAYAQSVAASVEPVVSASTAIMSGAHDENTQKVALNHLQKIKALEVPDAEAVQELTSPVKAYNKALKSFIQKDSPYFNVYEFALAVAKDIEYRKITTSDIIKALDEILAHPEKLVDVPAIKNFDQVLDKPIGDRELLTKEQIEKYSRLLFTRLFGADKEKEGITQEQESQAIISNILGSIQFTLGTLKLNDTVDSRQTKYESDIKKAEEAKIAKTKEAETIKITIESLNSILKANPEPEQTFGAPFDPTKPQMPAKGLPRPIPANAPTKTPVDPYAHLSPEEKQAQIARNIDQSYFSASPEELPKPGEFLGATVAPPKKDEKPVTESTEQTPGIPGVYSGESIRDAVIRWKTRLFDIQEQLAQLDQDIIKLNKNLEDYTNKKSEVEMVKFLTRLYTIAVNNYTAVTNKIKNTNIDKIKDSFYAYEFKPIRQATKAVITYIHGLKQESGSDLADDVLAKFETFEKDYVRNYAVTPSNTQKPLTQGISFRALDAFKRLVEEAEAVPPQPEEVAETVDAPPTTSLDTYVITERPYMLSMAKFLKEVEHVSHAKDWIVFGDTPGEQFYGVETCIQNACMVHFIGSSEDKTVFSPLKDSLNSKIALGFSVVSPAMENTREALYLQFTKLHDIARVANNDESFIAELLHPELFED